MHLERLAGAQSVLAMSPITFTGGETQEIFVQLTSVCFTEASGGDLVRRIHGNFRY